MAIPEFVLVPGLIIGGIAVVYFCILKCAHNDWIGKIPPGPIGIPFLGCLSIYLKTHDLISLIEKCFQDFGSIFQMRCCLQKIVFVQDSQVLLKALEDKTMKSTTISDLVTGLRKCGLKRFKRREIKFISKIWKNHALHFYREIGNDARLILKIAEKIDEEDTKEALENGDITKPPARLKSPSTAELLEMEEDLHDSCEEIVQIFRDLLLSAPHSWLGSWVFSFNTKTKTNRVRGKHYLEELKGYLDKRLAINNVQTEKKFLILIFLLIKLSNKSTLTATDAVLGPDVLGWRSFFCEDYAEVGEFHFPKKTNVYAT